AGNSIRYGTGTEIDYPKADPSFRRRVGAQQPFAFSETETCRNNKRIARVCMALNARNETNIKQQAVPHTTNHQPVRKKSRITKGEKVLYLSFLAVFVMCALLVLQNQATIQATTHEIQTIEHDISEIQKQNTDLSVQISELSTYERIWAKAKELGLKVDKDNVKVVPGQ